MNCPLVLKLKPKSFIIKQFSISVQVSVMQHCTRTWPQASLQPCPAPCSQSCPCLRTPPPP